MHKVGIIGDRDSVLGFKTVGMDAFPCKTSDEARKMLNKTAKEGYAIIFITEYFAKDMQESMDQYKDKKLPAIIPIPGIDGNHGIGSGNLERAVKRAVGADILFGGDN